LRPGSRAMMPRMQSMIRALGVTVTGLALSCARGGADAPPPAPSAIAPPTVAGASSPAAAPESAAAPGPFDARLLDAARVYTSWPKVTSTLGWASTDCAAPPPPSALHPSTSKDDATHGQKLFHLFAQNHGAYVSDYKKPAPAGQVLVKESWSPIPVPPEEQKRPSPDTAVREGKLYRKGERMGLFLMLKLDARAEGTDHGWIYGVVSGDGARVIAAGKLSSCMGCHANAPGDRLFGPPN
jgi:hypothetical protein